MCKSSFIAFFLVVLFISIAACKKTDHPPSTTCSILSFTFTGDDNPSLKNKKVTYTNTKDSMLITVPENTTLNGLIPTIVHNGIGMSPATKVKQDFTKPVYYTVIAEDGSQKNML